RGEFVVCGHDAALPLHVGAREGSLHRMTFEQQPQRGQLLQIVYRYRRHLEAASALGQDQPLRRQAAQDLPQRADADAIAFLEPVEPELLARRQAPKNDVAANAPMAIVADGFVLFGPFDQQRHIDPMVQMAPSCTDCTSHNRLPTPLPASHINIKVSYKIYSI